MYDQDTHLRPVLRVGFVIDIFHAMRSPFGESKRRCELDAYLFFVRTNHKLLLLLLVVVSDLRQVCGLLRVLRFPPPIKLTADISEILLKVA